MNLLKPLLWSSLAMMLAVPVRAAESADTDRRPVRGLIVEMRAPAARATETPQAVRERVRSAAQASGIVSTDLRALTERHHHLRFATVTDVAQARALVTRLRANPEVLSVEPDVLIRRQAVTPNDPLFTSRQWNLQAAGARAAAINMPAAWAVTTGTPVTVAVVDSGILPHPELAGRILPGYDFVSEVEFANDGNGRDADPSDPGDWVSVQDQRTTVFAGCDVATSSWHGTFIAGQIAAVTDNAEGIAGIHWNGRVLPVRVSGKCGAFLSDLLDGLRWSAGLAVTGAPANANPARVINLSLGGDAACSSVYQSVIDEVTAAGTLIVAAGGNEGGAVRRPADCRNVFAVGAVGADGFKTSYSNFGPQLALMAPGGESGLGLHGLSNSGPREPVTHTYTDRVGTSFSAPQVAAVAALMLSLNPSLNPESLGERLKAGVRAHVVSADQPSCSAGAPQVCRCTSATCGVGLLDAPGAVLQALRPWAVARVSGTYMAGGRLTADASASRAASGTNLVSYRWRQLSGPTLNFLATSGPVVLIDIPGTVVSAATVEVELEVTDTAGRSDARALSFTVLPGSGTGSGSGTGTGSGTAAPGTGTGTGPGSVTGSDNTPALPAPTSGGGAWGWGGLLALWALALLALADRRRR